METRVEVWRIDLREVLARHHTYVVGLLSEEERDRAGRFVFPRDRDRFTAARGAMRDILARYAERGPASLTFACGRYGKPRLVGSDLQFNLSHAEDWALLAVTRETEIGVDLEFVRALPDLDGILGIICSDAEKQRLAGLSRTELEAVFWPLWVSKEAVLKGEGCGFSVAPSTVELSFSRAPDGVYSVRLESWPGTPWHVHSFNPQPGYAAAIAVRSAFAPHIAACRDFTPAFPGTPTA
jgi:4'-phosphopantetheinyl transferase